MVQDVNLQMFRDGVEVSRRWAEYFEQVLNVEDVREVNINVVGDRWMPVLGDLNESNIEIGNKGSSEGNEIWEVTSRSGRIASGVFKERWYDSVRMACVTVERKFFYWRLYLWTGVVHI